MSNLERQLQASLAEADAETVAAIRQRVDARPLTDEHTTIQLDGSEAAQLVRIAEEGLRRRAEAEAPAVQIGARGRLVALFDGDDRNRLVALIEFDDEDELRKVAPLIATDVSIEPVLDLPQAANQTGVSAAARTASLEVSPGEGSPRTEEEP